MKNRSTLIVTLILAGPVSANASTLVLGLAKVVLGYVVYSIGIENYITRKFNSILQVSQDAILPLSQEQLGQNITNDGSSPSTTTVPSVSDLRKTISRYSHIVENPRNRERWKTWALSAPVNDASSTMESTPAGIRYKFAYRSYVDAEEKMAMLAPRLSFHRFRRNNFLSRKVGTMTIENDGRVSISDYFRMKLIKPVTISWYGRIETVGKRKRIVWTSTEIKLPEETIVNPLASERLRQIPWDIVTEEDGMLLLQRGDIGVLAYDRVE
jgi:hypothetical protein